jgi:hypothetical protein
MHERGFEDFLSFLLLASHFLGTKFLVSGRFLGLIEQATSIKAMLDIIMVFMFFVVRMS